MDILPRLLVSTANTGIRHEPPHLAPFESPQLLQLVGDIVGLFFALARSPERSVSSTAPGGSGPRRLAGKLRGVRRPPPAHHLSFSMTLRRRRRQRLQTRMFDANRSQLLLTLPIATSPPAHLLIRSHARLQLPQRAKKSRETGSVSLVQSTAAM